MGATSLVKVTGLAGSLEFPITGSVRKPARAIPVKPETTAQCCHRGLLIDDGC
jgi:hypothetical protein